MFSFLLGTNRVFAHHNRTFTPCSQTDLRKTAALYAIQELSQNPCNCFSDASQQNKSLSIATDLNAFKLFKYLIHFSVTLLTRGCPSQFYLCIIFEIKLC